MAPIHRMPVILGSKDWEKWLGEEPANDNELKAFPSERMSAWPIGKAISNVKNDDAELIERGPVRGSCCSAGALSDQAALRAEGTTPLPLASHRFAEHRRGSDTFDGQEDVISLRMI
jgi:hypothetical protein